MEPIHNRMPAILDREEEACWLDRSTDLETALRCLRPYPAEQMEAYPVSTLVLPVRH